MWELFLPRPIYHTCIHNLLPEDKTSGSKHVDDINNLKNYNINLEKVHFVGLYCIIMPVPVAARSKV